MEDTALPSQAPLVNSSGNISTSKSENRKRFGPSSDTRARLSRGNFALSRQDSFDVGNDPVEASSPRSLPMDESDCKSGSSPKSSNETASAAAARVSITHSGKSIRLQRANSSLPSTTTATALSSTNGSSSSISSQHVRQRLKEHLLSRRVMSVEASWGAVSNSGNSAGGGVVTGGTPPQTYAPLRRFSRSFDSDPAVSPPSPSLGEENNNVSSQRHPSPPLPRKRAAYHRSAAISLELPARQSSSVLVESVPNSRTFDEIAIEKLNTIWREAKSQAHFQQSSLPGSGGNTFSPFLKHQASYNPQMAHMCPEDLSKTGALNSLPNVDMPLDLTASAANDSLRRLNNECILLRQASANPVPTASVSDVSFFMQQIEAFRKASMQKQLLALNPASFSAPFAPPNLSVGAHSPSATSAAAGGTVSNSCLQETAASIVSSLTSLCQPPTQQQQQQQLNLLATSMFQSHLSTQVSQNLRETQENLAALTLSGPSRDSVVRGNPPTQPSPATPPPPSTTVMPSTNDFIRGALERAYDELQRHWNSIPVINSWPTAVERECAVSNASSGTGLLFDPAMLSHICLCPHGNNPQVHPEHPLRIISILERIAGVRLQIPPGLLSPGEQDSKVAIPDGLPLAFFCKWMRARMATREELAIFHTEEHISRYCSEELSATSSEDEGVHDRAMADDDDMVHKPSATKDIPTETGISRKKPSVEKISKRSSFPLVTLRCGGVGVDSDTVWNPGTTSTSARLAVGQVLCLAHNLACGRLRNGFAIVHPPGHHAEPDQATGFCYFNSVAIAALSILQCGLSSRVLILDWDIHHGNGTQFAATQHPGLLYISLHRYDQGTFFPGTGSFHRHGGQANGGCIINIPWGCTDTTATSINVAATTAARRESWKSATTLTKTVSSSSDSGIPEDVTTAPLSLTMMVGQSWTDSSPASSSAGSIDNTIRLKGFPGDSATGSGTVGLSDAEYLAAFRTLVIPMATEFAPDVVLVSAGFDAATGHGSALGGYEISPGAFAWMTRQCMSLANGKVGLVLEGGYVASVTAECVSDCLNALVLPNPPPAILSTGDRSSTSSLQSLAHLEDSLTTAKAWIAPSELSRAPRPEAVKTLLEVAAVNASSGKWKCLSNMDAVAVDFALPFNRAVEQERSRLLSS
ncbi:unnamed protein product [Hymenolepis diminuta]|nr:unnamed protein product [Hymenolepis diminuta]